jgi:acyl-[acyl-carrier-protein] desaturase
MKSSATRPDNPIVREALKRIYRNFFYQAERKRRWSLENDIPWDQVNHSMNPAIGDVVESFCAVELFLPDYISEAIPLIRRNRGWAWFHANWGYEESKHSLALGDWLLRSGLRTDEQMSDLERQVCRVKWTLPHDSPQGMLIYAMVQELATWLHYRNLREHVARDGDPALSRLLQLIAVDERAHHSFYRKVVALFLKLDRPGTLEQLARVMDDFNMPAVHLLADSAARVARIKSLNIFDGHMYMRDVYHPILESLGVKRHELRQVALVHR